MPGKKKERLVLLDSHAIIHRAYHALPDFSTAAGEPTGALFGLNSMLVRIIEVLKPDHIVAAFDLPEKTYRHEAYADYKRGRRKIDDSLEMQIERSKEVFAAWDIPLYSCPGFEADDIIGTIVEKLKKDKDREIVIASGDMDTLQLVEGKKVQVFTLRKGLSDTVLYDEKRVEERYGFPPKLLPDFKGLCGDPSDNIIGVKGIGEKSATTLVETFGTVESIYKNLRKGEKWKEFDIKERVRNILLENEEEALFSKTLATIRRDAPIDFKLPKPWRETLDLDKLTALFQRLEFRTMTDRVKKLLLTRQNPQVKKQGSDEQGPLHSQPEDKELELATWVVDSNLTNPTMEDVFAFTKTKTAKDAWGVINEELDKRQSRPVYEEIEKPLMRVVEAMNAKGVKIDRQALEGLSKDYHKDLKRIEKKIWVLAGEEFNIGSPRQLGEILFGKLGLSEKRQKKTASGGFSTAEAELAKVKDKSPIVRFVLDYRELAKLLSTYIDCIPEMLDKSDRLHSTFIQAGSTTGRMASQNPNLQNIPVRTPLGRAIRAAFISEKGKSLLSLDYSQIELRIAAIMSKDSKLIEIFKNGEDVHQSVASRVFKLPIDQVDKEMRRRAKTINFGILYGMGVNALKENLKTDRKDAQEFYNNYFETFSELARYIDEVKQDAERKGYTETMFGRRRYFSGFRSPLPHVRAQAERMAFNAPIQGTEADIVKIAMKKIDERIEKNNWREKISLILQVHDEIVYEADDDIVDRAGAELKKIMESVLGGKKTFEVPIIADAHAGKNWNNQKNLP